MWLEFRDWKLLRCLTAVAPQLRHPYEIATLRRQTLTSSYMDPSLQLLFCTPSNQLPLFLYTSTLRLRYRMVSASQS
jgi:hypothetical protein